tara:strand:+ start:55 stop:162 length:108 start_codon:yes stop_codon:yes gene_type:complete
MVRALLEVNKKGIINKNKAPISQGRTEEKVEIFDV